MVTKAQRWGKSQGMRLPLHVLANSGLAVGDEVEVSSVDGVITITPVRPRCGKYDIKNLVARIPKGFHSEEVDWRAPAGGEVW